jgi:ATP phosphoribosyltransferase
MEPSDGQELRLGLPKGSLEQATIDLFKKSGWKISGSSRSYFPSVDDETLRCSLARPQEMSRYVESGILDAGITGKDWTQENQSDVVVVAEMVYSKVSFRPTRWVLAVPHESPIKKIEDLKGKRIATEMVKFTKRYFAERNIPVEVEFSWGATEAKAAEGLVDAIVEVTETGTTIRGKDPWKRAKLDQIKLLLQGALSAEAKVGIKLNVAEADLEKIIELIPSITAPTVATLYPSANLKGVKWFSVESVIDERQVRDLIPKLIQSGAVGIIEYPLNKII